MRKNNRENDENFVWPQPEYLIVAIVVGCMLALVEIMGYVKYLSIRAESSHFALKMAAIALLYMGTVCFKIDENGITQFNFGIKTRQVLWSKVDQVGIGFTPTQPVVVITLKNYERYTPLTGSGRKNDAELFLLRHLRGCIIIYKPRKALPLLEKYYGELDYEWIPPDFK